jgi:hypothetical protein
MDENDVLALTAGELRHDIAAGVLRMNDRFKALLAVVDHHDVVAVAGALAAMGWHVRLPSI